MVRRIIVVVKSARILGTQRVQAGMRGGGPHVPNGSRIKLRITFRAYLGLPEYGVEATGQDRIEGRTLCRYLIRNAGRLQVRRVIWRQRIWTRAEKASEGWQPHSGGGSIPEGHYDHVHVGVVYQCSREIQCMIVG